MFFDRLSSILIAQTSNDTSARASEIISEITTFKIVQGIFIAAIAYGAIWITEKLIDWLSEKVPLQFRLPIKQSIPFWRAFILGLAGVLLINLFCK